MQHLLNSMRFQSGIGQNLYANTRIGIVTSYDQSNATVTCTVQPEDEDNQAGGQTGSIPIATPFIGQLGAPKIGDQVVITFQEGDLNNGIVIGKIYSSADVPPPVPSGEWWITHTSGSFIKIKNNGDIEISAAQNAKINADTKVSITASSEVEVTAPVINLSNGGTLKKLVNDELKDLYNAHTHGSGPAPDAPYQMNDAHLTSIVKGQ